MSSIAIPEYLLVPISTAVGCAYRIIFTAVMQVIDKYQSFQSQIILVADNIKSYGLFSIANNSYTLC